MHEVRFRTGTVYQKNLELLRMPASERPRILVNQGGTRSGKTYDILNLLILLGLMYRDQKRVISITRRYAPQLRTSVVRDFEEIMQSYGIWDEACWSKNAMEYRMGKVLFEFFGCDQGQKIRGRKRHVLYMNEANENDLDIFRQLMMRTSGTVLMDYNPSMSESYIYDHVLTRKDAAIIKSTYRDNPFLDANIRAEIDALRDTDPDYYRVYGLGERSNLSGSIYDGRWKLTTECTKRELEEIEAGAVVVYGMDFGYTVPTAAVRLAINLDKRAVLVEQVLYRSHLMNEDIRDALAAYMAKRGEAHCKIYADPADPDRIEWLRKNGLRTIEGARKHTGIIDGILTVRQLMMHVRPEDVDTQRELKRYRFHEHKPDKPIKTDDPIKTDKPIKTDDHLMDAIRYPIMSVLSRSKNRFMFG